jgi:hypothetical protein
MDQRYHDHEVERPEWAPESYTNGLYVWWNGMPTEYKKAGTSSLAVEWAETMCKAQKRWQFTDLGSSEPFQLSR